MTVVIAFISFDSDHRFIVTVRFISSNDVLVYVYIFFHVILSVVPDVRCCDIDLCTSLRASSSFSCHPSGLITLIPG